MLKYSNVSAAIDIEYELNSTMLKESIIVSSKQSEYVYKFSMNIGGLTPVANKDGSISLIDKDNEDSLEFVIAAPYMTDAKGSFSDSVTMSLTASGSEYILTVTADKEWLNSDDREFPVIIDPTLEYEPDREKGIFDTYVDSGAPTGNFYTQIYAIIGHNSLGTGRAYVKFNLPDLPHCGVITNAQLSLIQLGYDPGNGVANHIVVYESPSAQNYQTLTWNNQPSLTNQPIIDYTEFKAGTDGSTFYTLDITRIAKKWFEEGINNGLFLASANENSSCRSTIYTSNYMGYKSYPMILISYLDNKGLEDYWSYETVDLGKSGAVYVNEYNGLLTYVHSDINLGGNITSLSASHVYSAVSENGTAPYGRGFTVTPQENIKLLSAQSDLYEEGYRAVLTDGDTTAHYYKVKENSSDWQYEFDENIILKKVSLSTHAYELQFEDGSKRCYSSDGKLVSVVDRNSNKVTYTHDSSGRISEITDASGRKLTYVYDSSGYLTSMKDASNRTTQFAYTSGRLSRITYPDSKTTQFYYYSDNTLSSIKAYDGTSLYIYYENGRVSSLEKKGIADNNGNADTVNSLDFLYEGTHTQVTDLHGNKISVGFDNLGRAVSFADNEGNISTVRYNSVGNKTNTLAAKSDKFSFNHNLLLNHSLEGSVSGWRLGTSNSANTYSVSSSQHYVGANSAKLNLNGAGRIYLYQTVYDVEVLEDYTFSVYIKTVQMTNSKVYLKLEAKDMSGTIDTEYSQEIENTTDGWQRLQVTMTVPEDTTDLLSYVYIEGQTGNVYIDAAQLEKASSAGHYNLVNNPGLEDFSSGAFSYWTSQGGVSQVTGSLNNTASVKFTGSPFAQSRLVQTIPLGTSSEKRTLVFGGTAKGNAAASSNSDAINAKFAFMAELYSGDSLVESKTLCYNENANNVVQCLSDSITAETNVNAMKLYLLYDYEVNTAVFDDIFVYIDNYGTEYSYDNDGKLIKQENNAGDAITYEYTGPDIEKISITKHGEEKESYTYEYDSNHNITKETTKDGIVTKYTYPSSGNRGMPTAVTVENSSGTLISGETYTYSSDYNYLLRVTDARGNTVRYNYSAKKDILLSHTDANGNQIQYTYNALNDNILEMYYDYGDEYNLVRYSYDSYGNLSGITQDGMNYSFTYDDFNRKTSTSVASQTLASYSYNSKNLLDTTAYANGTSLSYTYDSLNRIVSEKYNGTDTYLYSYNTEGYLGKVTDKELGVTTYYGYDLIGRITDIEDTNGISMKAAYNSFNSTESYSVTKNGVLVSGADYTYADDGLISEIVLDGVNEDEFTYTYDSLNRRTSRSHNLSGFPIQVLYSYLPGTDSRTTGLISNIRYSDNGYKYMPELSYTYDANGNILTISENGVLSVKYAYDELNRLVREDNTLLDETIIYTYDKRGNILTRKHYDYSTSDPLLLLDT
ncbi:MAG: DNRLRE domain-containing protein, partial [Ruminococcaceae bacterium]|nr:DNRLRE domain-containing protein [Oscillospiraceae bacterium]